MITMLIIGALMGMLGGGYFLIPNIKDRVKGLVSDPIRLAKINGAILTAEEASKALDKKYKEYGKQLNELTKQRGTPEGAFMALYAEAIAAYKEVQEIFIQGRAVFIENLTLKEFSILTAPDAKETAKREEQVQDAIEKAEVKIPKDLDKISELALQIISDPERQQSVLAAVQDYQQSVVDFLQEYGTWNYRNNEILRDYKATDAQLQVLLDSLNGYRFNIYTAFSELYLRLSEACTDEEWKAAAKALKDTSKATG